MSFRTVLIVDDSSAEIANLRAIIAEAGWAAITAGTGREAVDRAKAEKPSVILMDIVMPDMDGYEACRALQADPATKTIPIVMVSTKNQKADHLWAKMQGARGLVGKPYSKSDIVDAIRAATG
ncbi:twitching motility two-component system response regulator PilH [Tahibacter aquaticus]|uniref:Twitching motility two-component system response regulator PilH n=1 Tax=Tahibacter aquaticus TaxID=520092 RepID=A0A4R6YMX1_9GAMM|nr:response regulator [Tahibacter aquaticus]TDR38702.1 twitching motility two-component system response regulator PilH [Tahibacter aquaticus]